MTAYHEIIQSHSRPLVPLPTAVAPRLTLLPDVSAVLFDIYGTLLISASGEVGSAGELQATAAAAAFAAVGYPLGDGGVAAADHLHAVIRQHHAAAHDQGIDYPEVDIVAVWSEVVSHLVAQRQLPSEARDIDCRALAIHYEVRANPTWPMPGMAQCLEALRQREVTLGIISNAQFYTPLLFPAHLGLKLEQLGFDPELLVFSYQLQRAKPAAKLFQAAVDTLFSRGLAPHEVLYIGNDMLNDVLGARQVGFRTALFAGDHRSLRWRKDDRRVADCEPDIVVTHLEQIVECLRSEAVGTEGRRNNG